MTETYTPSAGDRVRIRRYVQPSLTPGDCARELDADVEGTAASVGARGQTIDLDPASVTVRHVSEGHDAKAPFGLAWRIGLGYVFLGGSAREGTCRYLVTEVDVDPDTEPASTTPLADALAVVDRAQAQHRNTEAERDALRGLAEAVRTHLLAHPET